MKADFLQNGWIGPAVAAGVAGAYLLFGFLPGQLSLAEMSSQLAAKRDFVAQAAATLPALAAAEQQVRQANQYNAHWQEALLDDAELSTLFGRIHEMAKNSGVTTTRFQPESPVTLARVRRVPLAIGCTGQFGQIVRFLGELERLPQIVWVDQVRMEPAGQNKEAIQCEVILGIFVDNSENSDEGNQSG